MPRSTADNPCRLRSVPVPASFKPGVWDLQRIEMRVRRVVGDVDVGDPSGCRVEPDDLP